MLKSLNTRSLNKNMINFTYQVRGPIVNRAYEIQEELLSKHNRMFKKVIMCNIGNPQELKQAPISFMRQYIAACICPSIMKSDVIPNDVKRRAKILLDSSGSIGAYTHSQGLKSVRENVANYLSKRDSFKSNPDNIFLSNGASQVIKRALQMIIYNENDGVMVPIPQYPLYSASIEMFGGKLVGYHLNEKDDWSVNIEEMERSIGTASRKGVIPKAICVINPGNPTGQVMSKENIRDIIKFAKKHKLVILADEVYQHNIYTDKQPFCSFRKVLSQMDNIYKDQELMSFDSVSKGIYGECGLRGGYVELLNIDKDIKAIFLKIASAGLCPNVVGQIAVDVLTNPPVKGDESYDLFVKECQEIFQSLKRRAEKISKRLSQINGVSCNRVSGAMYAFPTIELPQKAIVEAEKLGMKADAFYCLNLLEEEGICTVPGSGFGQKDGTFHLRITILPPEDEFDQVLEGFERYHNRFMKKYGGQ